MAKKDSKQQETNRKQTKNNFKFIGKATRLDKDNVFKEQTMDKGKNEGKQYRSLRFGVKTSDTNEMTVQMFDFEPEEVFLWNSKKKEKDDKYKGEKIPYETWYEQQEELREEGFAVLQTRVGLTYDDKNKLLSKGLPSYVASERIYNALSNGESVVVEGEIRYSTYKRDDDTEVEQKTFTIKKIHRVKDLDFSAEDFEEITYFEQEMVFIDADIDKDEKKVYVTGRMIDYALNWHDSQFIIDFSDGNGGNDKDMVKLANNFVKMIKFGDLIKVYGDALNRVVVEEIDNEDDDDEDDKLALLGGKKKPKHAEKYVARNYISEMQIHGVEEWTEGVYTEDDFIKDELLEEDSNPFGGKKPKKGDNPFDTSDDDNVEISDDDLPF